MGRIWSNGSGLPLNAADLNSMETDITNSVKPWAASTTYQAGQAVISPNSGRVVTAASTFTSGTSFDPTKWFDPAAGVAVAMSIVFGG